MSSIKLGSTGGGSVILRPEATGADVNVVVPAAEGTLASATELASTVAGKGASLVRIADAGQYFSGSTVEEALQQIAAAGGAFGTTTAVDEFVGDGTTEEFELSILPVGPNLTDVYINGTYQNKNTYTLAGTTLTFSDAPPLNAKIEVLVNTNVTTGGLSAENVRYVSNSGGEQFTTVEAKLRETVSVKDFGAVGDGVTDDTAAIQAAIDAVIAAPASLFFPDGTYVITAPLVISETSGVELKASYRGATIKKTGNTVDAHYGVDALLIIQNTSPSYGYNHHIDGLSFDALTSSNAYGIYAPRISQTVIENGAITGAVIGIYSADAWLCSVRNMNVSCGNPASPTVIPAGSAAYKFDLGTSLFMQDCWARVCERGYYFTTNMSYSSMSSCACDGFSVAAYDFTGSVFSLNGCGAESTVGTSARVFKLNNARVSANGCSSYNLAPAVFFDLYLGEMSLYNSSFADSTSAGVGTTFKLQYGSFMDVQCRIIPDNTATVFSVDSTSKLLHQTATAGIALYYNDGTQKITYLGDANGDLVSGKNVIAGKYGWLGVTSGGDAQQKFAEKSAVDNTVRIFNVNQSSILFNVDGVDHAQIKSTGAWNMTPRNQPVSASAGDIYYDSGTNKLRCYNGSIWNDLF